MRKLRLTLEARQHLYSLVDNSLQKSNFCSSFWVSLIRDYERRLLLILPGCYWRYH
jgi:hypothetical protein